MRVDDFTRFGDFKPLEQMFPDLEDVTMSEANGRLPIEMGPKDGTYIKVFMSTAPFAVILNVYWCDRDEGWAEGGRIFIPELPISATWELMDEPINLKEPPPMVEVTDAAVEALAGQMRGAAFREVGYWGLPDKAWIVAARHVLASRQPKPGDVEQLTKLLSAVFDGRPGWAERQARAILALYDAPTRIPTRSALDSALDPILGNSNARRAVVDAVLGAFGGVADYRVPTEVDLERIASGVWGRSASRGVNVPSWKDLHEAKRLYIRLQVRDTLAYATIKPNAECDLRAATARIATLEAELAAAKSAPVGTIRLGEGLTEEQEGWSAELKLLEAAKVEEAALGLYLFGWAPLGENRTGVQQFHDWLYTYAAALRASVTPRSAAARVLTEKETADAAFIASEAWRKWVHTSDQRSGWHVVIRNLAAAGWLTAPSSP